MSTNAMLWTQTPAKVAPWEAAVRAALPRASPSPSPAPSSSSARDAQGDGYTQLVSRQLVGMLLLVYVRTALLPHITELQVASMPVGFAGVVGNKGAVATRFLVHRTSV